MLARVPRVGAVAAVEEPAAVAAPAFPPAVADAALPVEVSVAKPQVEVEPLRRGVSATETNRRPEPDYKVSLASRLFRFHEAIAPHSGFIMAATLLVAGGLLTWINSTSQQEASSRTSTFAFSESNVPQRGFQWASNTTKEFAGEVKQECVEEPCSLDDFAAADTAGSQAAEVSERGDASLAPLPAPYVEGGYHSTGLGANYLSAIRQESAAELAKRPVQDAR